KGDVERVLGPQVEQTAPHQILANHVRIGEGAPGNPVDNLLPALAVIGRLVDERVPIVHLMEVDGDVCGGGVVARRLDVAHGAPGREVRNVGRHVGPALAPVSTQVEESVVGAGPEQPRLERRFGNGEHYARVLDADVVGGETAGDALL